MNVVGLVEKCENNVGWMKKPAWYSFTSNFEYFKKFIKDDLEETGKRDLDKFIEICDNRIERAKALLSDVATVLGFGVTGAAIIISFTDVLSLTKEDISLVLTSLFAVLVVGIVIGFLLLVHYRTHVHAWTAFKEAAILSENYKSEREMKNAHP